MAVVEGSRPTVAETVDGIVRIVEHFGWPGALLIVCWRFVESHGTIEQKREIIDRFILGKGVTGGYPFLVMGGVFVLVVVAQYYFWQHRTKVLINEIERLSKWKSEHQEKKIGTDLHHTDER